MKTIPHLKHLTVVQVSATKNNFTGDYVYRIGQPAKVMGEIPGTTVINVTNTCPYLRKLCLHADILVLHLMGEHDLLPIVNERKRNNLPTIYEISDNFMAFPNGSPVKPWFSDPDNLSTTFQLIGLADAAQGVSDILLDRFGFLNDTRMVFENHLVDLGAEPETSHDQHITIGWAGSSGHTEDLRAIAGVIHSLCKSYHHVRFSFMGNRQQYDAVFGDISNENFSYREPGSLSDYFHFLDGLDIGIAPLLDTPYNVCRSDVKFIEYASRGVIPVLSDVGPYRKHARHGINAFLFKNMEELKSILTSILSDPSHCLEIKRAAYDYVKKVRMEKDHASERINFYSRFVSHQKSDPLPLNLLEKIVPESEYYHPKPNPAERLIIEGAFAQADGLEKEAERLWFEASRLDSEYSFPWYCLGKHHMQRKDKRAIHYFQHALSIDPYSLKIGLLLGKTLKTFGEKDQAGQAFKKTLEVFPGFAPAWLELALLEQEEGRPQEAEILLNRALEVNPFHAEAAFRLGKIHQEQGRESSACDAFGIAADLLPENHSYQKSLLEALLKSSPLSVCGAAK